MGLSLLISFIFFLVIIEGYILLILSVYSELRSDINMDNKSLSEIKIRIFNYIAERSDISKFDLQRLLSLSSSSLGRVLQEMVEEQLLIQSGYGPSSGGRKPILYNINAHYGYIIGIEISRFYAVLGLFDMKLNAKALTRWRMDSTMNPYTFIEYIDQTISSFCNDHQITKDKIIGIGIGAVGPLDRNQGMIINPKYYSAEGWNNIAITTLIEDKIGIKAVLDNGTDCAALGEQLAFRTQGSVADHLLYINVGVGLRSAMISGGHLVQGIYDREGAFGQMIIKAGDAPVLNGCNPGALENYVSIPVLVEQVKKKIRLGRTLLSNQSPVNDKDVDFDLLIRELRLENPFITELFQQSATYLGIGVANLINIFQPNKVILGGSLINSYKEYAQLVAQTAELYTYNFPSYQTQFTQGILMEDAVATGAALLVRNRLS